jgi:hypothetical protein
MEPITFLLLVMISFSGIICLLLGYKIRQSQAIEFVSLPNLSLDKIKDKVEFSRYAGNRAMMIGCGTLSSAIMILILPQFIMEIIIVLIVLITIVSLEFVISSKQYLLRD